MSDQTSSFLSGGFLVVVGIVLALGIVYFMFGDRLGLNGNAGNGADRPSVSINLPDAPKPTTPSAPAAAPTTGQ